MNRSRSRNRAPFPRRNSATAISRRRSPRPARLYPVYDPFTVHLNPAYDPTKAISLTNPQYIRTVFPDNVVPKSQMNAVSTARAAGYSTAEPAGRFHHQAQQLVCGRRQHAELFQQLHRARGPQPELADADLCAVEPQLSRRRHQESLVVGHACHAGDAQLPRPTTARCWMP